MKEAYTGCTVETMQPATMNAPTSARMEQEIVALKQKQNSTHSKKLSNLNQVSPITGSGELGHITKYNKRIKDCTKPKHDKKQLVGGKFVSPRSVQQEETKRNAPVRTTSVRNEAKVLQKQPVPQLTLPKSQEELLAEAQLQLETKLLTVSRKMNYKFRSNDINTSTTGGKVKEFAKKWSKNPNEEEKQDLYMKGRYLTAAEMSYHAKSAAIVTKHNRVRTNITKYK